MLNDHPVGMQRVWLANSIQIGEQVWASGFPALEGPYLTSGYVSRISIDDSMAISANGRPGSSGSGVYNSKGQLVGILHRGYQNSEFMILVVPLYWINQFFNSIMHGKANSSG